MTKAEIRDEIVAIETELARLEKTHGENVDMRPWVSNDHPISIQHWGLVQQRLKLNRELKKPVWTSEQRLARSQRMTARQQSRHNRAGEDAGYTVIDDLTSDGATGQPA